MTAEERLALVLVKVERADKYIRELDTVLKAFYDTNPYEIRKDPDPSATYRVVRLDPVPHDLSAIAGDVIQNLRSALDHLAQQLYFVGTGATTHSTGVYFPIDSNAAQFKASAPGKINRWRQDAKDVLYAIEPYDGGKGADLSVLNRLNRIDKHRLLITLHSQLRSLNLGAHASAMHRQSFPHSDFPKMDLFVRPADKSPLKVGSVVFIGGLEKDHGMDFRLQVSFYEPGVIEGEPVLITLQNLAKLVRATIGLFKLCLA